MTNFNKIVSFTNQGTCLPRVLQNYIDMQIIFVQISLMLDTLIIITKYSNSTTS